MIATSRWWMPAWRQAPRRSFYLSQKVANQTTKVRYLQQGRDCVACASRPASRGKVYRPPAAVLWDEQTVALDQVTKDPAWLQVVAYFHQRLHEEFLLGLRDITLVMGPMQDFQAFALNSFLGRLFMAFADEATCPYHDSFRVLSMTSVDDVGSIALAHACTPDPKPCHPLPHKVLITTPDGIQTEQVFDVVILR